MSFRTDNNTTKQRDKVEQFVYNSSGPLDASSCRSATGVNIRYVRNYLRIFESWGLVKKIRHKNQYIYVRMRLTPDIKYRIRIAKMREVADWLNKHRLWYD